MAAHKHEPVSGHNENLWVELSSGAASLRNRRCIRQQKRRATISRVRAMLEIIGDIEWIVPETADSGVPSNPSRRSVRGYLVRCACDGEGLFDYVGNLLSYRGKDIRRRKGCNLAQRLRPAKFG